MKKLIGFLAAAAVLVSVTATAFAAAYGEGTVVAPDAEGKTVITTVETATDGTVTVDIAGDTDSVTFSTEALASIATSGATSVVLNFGTGYSVEIAVTDIAGADLTAVAGWDLGTTVEAGTTENSAVIRFAATGTFPCPIKVTISAEELAALGVNTAEPVFFYHKDDAGKITKVEGSVDADGCFVATISGASSYIVSNASDLATTPDDTKGLPDTGVVLAVIPALVAGAAVVASRKRK